MTPLDFFVAYWFEISFLVISVVTTILVNIYASPNVKRKFNRWTPQIYLSCLWIVVRRMWINVLIHWKVPDIVYMIFTFLFLLSFLFMYREKYMTPGFVIAEGCKGCYYTPPIKIGQYTIFNVGSSCKTFPYERGDFVLVVPTDLISWLGPLAYCNVQVTRRDSVKLPIYVLNYIKRNKNYNLDDVWYGIFDRKTLLFGEKFKDLEGKGITPADFQEALFNANQNANTTQSFLDKDTRAIEDHVSSLERVNKSLGGKKNVIVRDKQEGEDYGT